jgi:hypothetical protein
MLPYFECLSGIFVTVARKNYYGSSGWPWICSPSVLTSWVLRYRHIPMPGISILTFVIKPWKLFTKIWFLVVGLECRASCMLNVCSTIELYTKSFITYVSNFLSVPSPYSSPFTTLICCFAWGHLLGLWGFGFLNLFFFLLLGQCKHNWPIFELIKSFFLIALIFYQAILVIWVIILFNSRASVWFWFVIYSSIV